MNLLVTGSKMNLEDVMTERSSNTKHPDAPIFPVYIDLRMLRRVPEVKVAAIDVYEELVKSLEYDLLTDIPTAATPLVSSLSDRIGVGMITPRTDTGSHGTGAKVDGLLETDSGKRVIVLMI